MKNSKKWVAGIVVVVLVVAALVFSNTNLFKGSMQRPKNPAVKLQPALNNIKQITTIEAEIEAEFKTKCQSIIGENACWEAPMTCWMHGGGCGTGASFTTLAALNAEIARLANRDVTKPTASFQYPTQNLEVQNTIDIVMIADDNIGVTKVEFTIDGHVYYTWAIPSANKRYIYTWNTIAFSNPSSDLFHILGVIAYDAAGNRSDNVTIRVKVKSPSPLIPYSAPYTGPMSNCTTPYHTVMPNGSCMWNCGEGTRPCHASNTCCDCAPNLVPAGNDVYGRMICR